MTGLWVLLVALAGSPPPQRGDFPLQAIGNKNDIAFVTGQLATLRLSPDDIHCIGPRGDACTALAVKALNNPTVFSVNCYDAPGGTGWHARFYDGAKKDVWDINFTTRNNLRVGTVTLGMPAFSL